MAPRISSAVALLAASSSLATASSNNGPVALSLTAESVAAPIDSLSRRNADIPLANISSITYLVSLTIGTPGQKVRVVVDTGSDELWVNPTCNATSSSSKSSSQATDLNQRECLASGHYDPHSSSTSKNMNAHSEVQYMKGSVTFDYYNDTVAQTDSGVSLKSLQFGVARYSTEVTEGVLGLGFSANTESRYTGKYTTFVDAVAQQNATGGTNRVFSVALASSNQANAGSMVLGGLDLNKFTGPMMSAPILAPVGLDQNLRYWVKLDSIGLSGSTVSAGSGNNAGTLTGNSNSTKTYSNSGQNVVLDTGSTLSILPFGVMEALAKDLGASTTSSQGYHGLKVSHLIGKRADGISNLALFPVPCSSIGLGTDVHSKENQAGLQRTVDFSFNNGAAKIRVPLSEFAMEAMGLCFLGALSSPPSSSSSSSSSSGTDPTGNTFLLGASFLRAAYVVFDQSANSVFMAPYAECNNGSANLQPLSSAKAGAAAGMTGACSVADSLYGGGAGGYAAAAAAVKSGSGTNSNDKKNAGLRSVGSVSPAAIVAAFLSVVLAVFCV